MSHEKHPGRPPEIEPLLAALHAHGVRYVLTGSVAAKLYGVDLQPGDLDITPALDQDNLSRLAGVLLEIEAYPDGKPGRWQTQPNGEQKWIVDESAAAITAWQPDPDRLETFDHLFRSRYGNFDVVPEISGRYDDLIGRAVGIEAFGLRIHVAHIDDLLATLTVPRREKDVPRVRRLRALQRQRGTNGNDA